MGSLVSWCTCGARPPGPAGSSGSAPGSSGRITSGAGPEPSARANRRRRRGAGAGAFTRRRLADATRVRAPPTTRARARIAGPAGTRGTSPASCPATIFGAPSRAGADAMAPGGIITHGATAVKVACRSSSGGAPATGCRQKATAPSAKERRPMAGRGTVGRGMAGRGNAVTTIGIKIGNSSTFTPGRSGRGRSARAVAGAEATATAPTQPLGRASAPTLTPSTRAEGA